jgi:HEAT repeat protein
MGLTSQKTPDVAGLVGERDVAALVALAEQESLETSRDGRTVDAAVPVRHAAVLGLAEIGDRDALPILTNALRDPSDAVRCAAIRALCDWNEAVPIAEAIAWLPGHGKSRSLALAAVAEVNDPATAPVLATSLIHGGAEAGLWEEEAAMVSALCRTNGSRGTLKRVLGVLLEGLEYHDERVAGRAEDFLLWFGDDAASAVIDSIRNSSAPHRSVWLLGQIGGAIAVVPLIEALEHLDARARAEACVALGELRDPIAVEPLLQSTYDSEHDVRVKAGAAIDRLGTVAILAGLTAREPAAAARLTA